MAFATGVEFSAKGCYNTYNGGSERKKLTALFDKIGRDALAGVLCLAMALLLFFSDGAVLLTVVKIIGGLITVAAVIRLMYLSRASADITLPIGRRTLANVFS